MKLVVHCNNKDLVGEFAKLTVAREAIKRHIDDSFTKDYHKELRQVHEGEVTVKQHTVDLFAFYEKPDRDLKSPKVRYSITYVM